VEVEELQAPKEKVAARKIVRITGIKNLVLFNVVPPYFYLYY
jgi:hypothetical protein